MTKTSLIFRAHDIVSEDFENFEQFGLDKLQNLWPKEHKLAVLQAQKEWDYNPDFGINLLKLCEQIASSDEEKFLADLKVVLANMYS